MPHVCVPNAKTARWLLLALVLCAVWGTTANAQLTGQTCERDLTARVVALDQPYFWNRLGAVQPHGMMYALERDVVRASNPSLTPLAGDAALRESKRPRPLVLRMNVGDCLRVTFTNLLRSTPADEEQVATREASVHVVGMQLVGSIQDDGSFVGANPTSSLASPGQTRDYVFYAEREGTYLLHSNGALIGGEGDNGHISAGLFGAVNVEPRGSVWYRSQVTREEMDLATRRDNSGNSLTSANGHPLLDYGARYPTGHPFENKPILAMLDGTTIYHSDLNAIIAGNGYNSRISPNPYPDVKVLPERDEPFREFTIIFHDEIAAVQAFPQFNDEVLSHTLHSVRDAFAINYGTGGIGAEIFANRIGVGPMYDCTECLYEEFFLSAWAVGDPAMVVDVPANAPCSTSQLREEWDARIEAPPCVPNAGPKATKAFYPDDPSNVYHSYLNDHVKFRNLLAGSDDHHIFHLHAHQWLHTPDSDNSTYLDSQAIGQGTSFTYEIAHGGSGNRNKTVGDSIFHCHFYPHFAQGMWAMWRTHDVFEQGTELDEKGRPITEPGPEAAVHVTTRALPDAEILHGTPIPGIVPLPGLAMPPMPEVPVALVNGQISLDPTLAGNPGYPFWVPGVAGHRPPRPPMDVWTDPATGDVHDGGLPRHVITGGAFVEEHTRLSFHKEVTVAQAVEVPEGGDHWELQAMDFHADTRDGLRDGLLASFKPDGSPAGFTVNGADAVPGAPYADPCLGGPTTPDPLGERLYKAANIEMDVIFNKEGWHFPQQRFISLWEDVDDFLDLGKPPEPFFFRANSKECITFLHTNLVPKEYQLDDFQVRTPTDVLGQHIHLVKFDVTSSDGGGNGFNYEDGTLSPEEVVGRIGAINAGGGLLSVGGTQVTLTPKHHPAFLGRKEGEGAQTTVQRWFADDTLNMTGKDRTLRTVFTHDHYGPSTHQQTGLYAGLVVEPTGSTWYHNESGVQLGTRGDGGPTSWQATIEGPTAETTYREFLFEFGDFQHAYTAGSPLTADPTLGLADPARAINPPGRKEYWDQLTSGRPWIYEKPAVHGEGCPGGEPAPCPEAISAADPGTMVVNYRNEPLALRIFDPARGFYGGQAAGKPGDLAYAYSSTVTRKVTSLNTLGPQPLSDDLDPKDPYTPMLRAYENDRVHIRVLVGSHEEEHNFTVDGVRWLFEPSDPNSGYRASQMMGISEHFEFEIPNLPKNAITQRGSVDFLYRAGTSVDDQWNGLWGLMRSYRGTRTDLTTLSTNADGQAPDLSPGAFNGVCPKPAPVKAFDVTAIAAVDLFDPIYGPMGSLTYNSRNTALRDCHEDDVTHQLVCTGSPHSGPLHQPDALLFVHTSDLVSTIDAQGNPVRRLAPGRRSEPLILRANAGDCIEVTLRNDLPSPRPDSKLLDLSGYSLMPNIIDRFNANQVGPSKEVGLHAQLVDHDVTRDGGLNVGFNPDTTVSPGQFRTYRWYAGAIQKTDPNVDTLTPVDIEFGSINLTSADPIKHSNKGLVGGLIVEPAGTTWREDPGTRASAWIDYTSAPAEQPSFREQVLIYQDDVNLFYADGARVRPTAIMEDPAETGQDAVNYRTEPAWFRKAYLPETDPTATRHFTDLADTFSNSVTGGKDPETPICEAAVGDPVRFRLLHPAGHSQNNTFGIHGHVWQEEPYVNSSRALGNNPYSEWRGSQHGHGPSNHFDVLIENGAGGAFGVTGDYMWRDYVPWYLANGIWGIFRVHPAGTTVPTATPVSEGAPGSTP